MNYFFKKLIRMSENEKLECLDNVAGEKESEWKKITIHKKT